MKVNLASKWQKYGYSQFSNNCQDKSILYVILKTRAGDLLNYQGQVVSKAFSLNGG